MAAAARAATPATSSLFTALYGIPLMAVPLAASVPELMLAMFAAGLFSAPFIIAMFGIRQRSVEPYLHGRVFAITVSINAAGVPAGAFLAGLLVGPVGVHHLLYGAGLAQPLAAGLAAVLLARRRSCPDARTAAA